LNAKIYQFADYSVEVIHDPINHLSRFLQNDLVSECTELSRDSFGNPNVKEAFVRHCVLNASTLLLGRDDDGQLVGYSSNSIKVVENYHIIYLQATVVLEKFQGRGLRGISVPIKILEEVDKIKKAGIDTSHILLASRTQSPSVFKFIARHLGLFPQPDGTIDPVIRRLGKPFMECLYEAYHDANGQQIVFDEQYFIERGAYKSVTQTSVHGVYPAGIPYCRDDDAINHYMGQHLDWQNGDALIAIGYYNDAIINRMFQDAQQRMGFRGVQEVELDRAVAVS
jgi:hypothetical protein